MGLEGPDRDVREEIRFHLEERAKELEAQGMDADEARREARRAFGDVDRFARAAARQDRMTTTGPGRGIVGGLLQDMRFALRGLGRSRGFTAVALATLALGIGANTAIYSVAEAVFLHAPPVRDAGSLVTLYTTCSDGRPRCSSSYPDYRDYRDRSARLADLAAVSSASYSVAPEGGAPELLTTFLVTGNYFEVLGLAPSHGRLLQPADHDPAGPVPVAVLAHDTWRTRFGADPGLVGRTLRVNGVPIELVGVAPKGFRGTALSDDPDLFLPMASGSLMGINAVAEDGVFEDRGSRWIGALVGRLRPGADADALQEEMRRLAADLNAVHPDLRGERSTTVDRMDRYSLPQFGREELTRMMSVLAFVVGATLLLACANLANLLLARAATRRREMGVRRALGAGTGRLLRQVLTETVVLALLGGAAGLGTAAGLLALLGRFTLPGGVSLEHVGAGLDGSALLFAAGVSVLTGLAFGLAPALRSARAEGGGSLRNEIGGSRRERSGRHALVAVQVALCVVLLTGAGLFLRTLRTGLTTDLGFRHENLALLRFDLGTLRYGPDEGVALLESMRRSVTGLPGVSGASYGSRVPLQVGGNRGAPIEVPGYEPATGEEVAAQYVIGGPDFLRVLGVEMESGADALSAATSAEAVVIDGDMARRFWSGGEAVGASLTLGGTPLTVAGTTRPVRWREVAGPAVNYVVVPAALAPGLAVSSPVTFAVRTRGEAAALLPVLRDELRAVEPRLTFFYTTTAEDLLGSALAPQRMGALLLSAFAGLGLLLAGVGIGGVVAFTVSQKRREIGVRMALGAPAGRVVRDAATAMVLPVVLGLVVGVGAAYLLRSSVEAFLIGVGPGDPSTYAAAVLALAGVAALSALIPARAAARVHPMEVLRRE